MKKAFPEEESTDLDFDEARKKKASRRCLLVIGEGIVTTYGLPECGQLDIGRQVDAEVFIDHPSISRQHARLHIAETIQVEDLGSANGTFLHDQQLVPGNTFEVAPGDVIEVASTMLIVQDSFTVSRARRIWAHGYFEARLEEECARAERSHAQFTVFRLRLQSKRAKAIAVTELLLGTLRPSDIVAAYGPDDYEVLVVDAAPEEAMRVLERLREVAKRRRVRIRTGVAHYPRHGRSSEELMAKACDAVTGRVATDEPSGLIELHSPAMRTLHRLAERVAPSDINVLILGETGVGKEVFAERIHALSPRVEQPFLRLNCAAFSENLLESELFGHVRGAFTGAAKTKQGLLESAHRGTVFLDEIGDLPLAMQAKLLRVLEDREIRRIGSVEVRAIDVRFIAATNRNLEAMASTGRFRRDLFFRLNGVSIVVPPLRERVQEISSLAKLFIAEATQRSKLSEAPKISAQALDMLQRYDWPGNIRELRNLVERAVLLSAGREITAQDLLSDKMGMAYEVSWVSEQEAAGPAPEPAPKRPPRFLDAATASHPVIDMKAGVKAAEREMIVEALERCGGNQTRAAKLLGISRRTLINRMERYGLKRPRKGS